LLGSREPHRKARFSKSRNRNNYTRTAGKSKDNSLAELLSGRRMYKYDEETCFHFLLFCAILYAEKAFPKTARPFVLRECLKRFQSGQF